jgi:DNA-binding MarR family transcriptional regulator
MKPSTRKAGNKIARPVIPQDTTGFRLWHVQHQWLRFFDGRLDALNLTHLQFVLLVVCHYLAGEGEVPSQIRLASVTAFDKMMVSKALRLLESKGYIKRRRHPDDPRAKRIDLTGEGTRVMQRGKKIASKALGDFFGVLGKNNERTLSRLLQVLMNAHGEACPMLEAS